MQADPRAAAVVPRQVHAEQVALRHRLDEQRRRDQQRRRDDQRPPAPRELEAQHGQQVAGQHDRQHHEPGGVAAEQPERGRDQRGQVRERHAADGEGQVGEEHHPGGAQRHGHGRHRRDDRGQDQEGADDRALGLGRGADHGAMLPVRAVAASAGPARRRGHGFTRRPPARRRRGRRAPGCGAGRRRWRSSGGAPGPRASRRPPACRRGRRRRGRGRSPSRPS